MGLGEEKVSLSPVGEPDEAEEEEEEADLVEAAAVQFIFGLQEAVGLVFEGIVGVAGDKVSFTGWKWGDAAGGTNSLIRTQDPLTVIREQCEQSEKCVKLHEKIEACDARVSARSQTEEECTEELFDFLHARDHCVAHKLFSKVK